MNNQLLSTVRSQYNTVKYETELHIASTKEGCNLTQIWTGSPSRHWFALMALVRPHGWAMGLMLWEEMTRNLSIILLIVVMTNSRLYKRWFIENWSNPLKVQLVWTRCRSCMSALYLLLSQRRSAVLCFGLIYCAYILWQNAAVR